MERSFRLPLLGILGMVLVNMGAAAQSPKPGATRSVVMTEGIVGGIVAPTIRFRAVLVGTADGSADVWVQQLQGETSTFLAGKLEAKLADGLFQEFDTAGLWKLPRENPEGGDDIYGEDTSLGVKTASQSWRNGGPAGCNHMESSVHPTTDQKATFRRLAARVKSVAIGAAHNPSDAKALEAALDRLR